VNAITLKSYLRELYHLGASLIELKKRA
jgi:hypothetical protein